jgi:isoleucyl-tRNA synthetase
VEKELRISGKDAIEAYGVEPFVRRCLDSVFRYTEEWQSFTEKLGFWLDMGDAYVTYHQSYVESVWWALSQLFARGLLYRGHKVVWWWAQGGTVLSAAEVARATARSTTRRSTRSSRSRTSRARRSWSGRRRPGRCPRTASPR